MKRDPELRRQRREARAAREDLKARYAAGGLTGSVRICVVVSATGLYMMNAGCVKRASVSNIETLW